MEIAIHCLFLMTRSIIYGDSIKKPKMKDHGLLCYKIVKLKDYRLCSVELKNKEKLPSIAYC